MEHAQDSKVDKDPVKKARMDGDSSPGGASDSPRGMDTDSAEKEEPDEKQLSPSFLMEAVANAAHLITACSQRTSAARSSLSRAECSS